jgi:hypothetical protein
VGVADVESIVEKAVTAAITVIRDEFRKLFDDLLSRVQVVEERLDRVEDKFQLTEPTNEIASLTAELKAVRTEAREFAQASNDSEQYHRRLDLRIKGLAVNQDSDCLKAVVDFVRGTMKLSITDDEIDVAHVLPSRETIQKETESTRSSRSHPTTTVPQVIVRFKKREVRDNIIQHRRVLKGTNMAVVEDLTALNMKTINRLRQNSSVQKTWTWNGRIYAMLTNNRKICVRPFQTIEDCIAAGHNL